MVYYQLLVIAVALCMAIYYNLAPIFKRWKKMGIPGPRPVFFFGNALPILSAKTSIPHFMKNLYEEYEDEPFVGLFILIGPILMLKDPEHIKHVLIRDFSKFDDRGLLAAPKVEPLSQCLPQTTPPHWRPMRLNMTTIFTTAKLKMMYRTMSHSARQFEQQLDKLVTKGEPVNWCDVAAEFAVETIGLSLVGIDKEYLATNRSEFLRMAKLGFGRDLENNLRLKLRLLVPEYYDAVGKFIAPEKSITTYFRKVAKDVMMYRIEHGIVKPDLVGLYLETWKKANEESPVDISTQDLVVSEIANFLTLGVEVLSLVTRHGLYELAQNQQVQDKLREEIRKIDAKYEELDYGQVKEMKYLDKVYKEIVRIFPSVSLLTRVANTEYTFEGTKVTIPKGQMLVISVLGIHHDRNIYPNPHVFDPERFSEEAIAARHPMNYVPFGAGPRTCIATRFVAYQTKLSLLTILRKFRVDVCDKTMIPYVPNTHRLSLTPHDDIYLTLTKVDS